jgi:hypothetical protein
MMNLGFHSRICECLPSSLIFGGLPLSRDVEWLEKGIEGEVFEAQSYNYKEIPEAYPEPVSVVWTFWFMTTAVSKE